TIQIGSASNAVHFTPLKPGTTAITARSTGPSNFVIPASGQSVNVIVPAPVISLVVTNNVIQTTHSTTATITLGRAAPSPGVTVFLSATPDGIVSLFPQQSVNIPTGQTVGTFNVTGVAQGSTTITVGVSDGSYQNGSASVTVIP